MKEGWTYKKLGEVALFSRGLTYSKRDEVDFSEKIVLRSNNIDLFSGKLDFSELKYLNKEFDIPKDKRLKKGSLFICMSNGSKAHLGKVAYVDRDYNYAFGGFMGQITPSKEIDGRYLHYALCSPEYKNYIISLSEGANINNLKYRDLELFVIPIPTLAEQKAIVSRLDAAFAQIDQLKANADKQLCEARALFQNTLTEAMKPKEGWEENILVDICEKIVDCPHTTPRKSTTRTIYPCIRTTELKKGEIDWSTMQYLDESEYLKRITRLAPQPDDIVYGREGTYGDAVILPDGYKFALGQRTMLLRAKKNIVLPRYLLKMMISTHVYNQAKSKNSGCGVGHVNVADIKGFKISLPPLPEQQRIVARLDSISTKVKGLKEAQRKIVAECDALKQAILRQIFE